MHEDLVYGIHVIDRLLETRPDQILEVYVMDTRADQQISSIATHAKQQGISVTVLSKKQMDAWLKNANHQGIAARSRPLTFLPWDDLLEQLQKIQKPPLLLILDGIQDPHNLGACLRTADAAGVTAVIIPKDRSASVTPTVRKVASGAAETVPMVQVTNVTRCLEELKDHNIWIIGTSVSTDKSLYDVDLKAPTAMVLGAEGTGLRRLTEEHCDVLMRIPMLGVVESLNVSVSAGICLYEAVRQRSAFTKL